MEERNRRIAEAQFPLPGSIPYENIRCIHVPARFDGFSVIGFLNGLETHFTLQEWLAFIGAGHVFRENEVLGPQRILRAGDTISHRIPNTIEPDVDANLKVVFEDESLFIVNKPAPLPVHPSGRFNRNTALYILKKAFPDLSLRPVHRLDASTTGALIFAK